MRIIRGRYSGRNIEPPEGLETRPTADRVREAAFQILEVRWLVGGFEGRLVYDLYAGSGAVGIEALSRGAARVVFFEHSPTARRAIQYNLDELKIPDNRYRIVDLELPEGLGSHSLVVPTSEQNMASVVFSDPPYGDDNQQYLGELLDHHQGIAPDAVWCHECSSNRVLQTGAWNKVDRRGYGSSDLLFMFRGEPPQPAPDQMNE